MPAPAKSKTGYLSRQEVAKRFGITITSVANWISRGLPVDHKDPTEKGSLWFKAEDVDNWFNTNEKKHEGIEEAELRKKVADATLAEIRVAKERGELVSMDVVLGFIAQELSVVRAKIISLPGVVAPHIYVESLPERIYIMEEAISQVLQELTVDKLTKKQLTKKVQDA
jgi:hypothetical protein